MEFRHNLTSFFEELFQDLNCRQDTRAYITGVFNKYKGVGSDLSKDSITLLFSQARNQHNFITYQNLSDWIFWTNTYLPEHLTNASKDYYNTVARVSYYACYRMTNRQWLCYEQMADQLVDLELQVMERLKPFAP